jgi:hypothetical protein
MNREDLDARNRAAIRKHWRDLGDRGGDPPPGLLAELAEIADAHALGYAQECLRAIDTAREIAVDIENARTVGEFLAGLRRAREPDQPAAPPPAEPAPVPRRRAPARKAVK